MLKKLLPSMQMEAFKVSFSFRIHNFSANYAYEML